MLKNILFRGWLPEGKSFWGKTVVLSLLLGLFWIQSLFAQVDTAWVRRYNGPGNSEDRAPAIAVDGSGNVYVTGYSTGSGTGGDYATIKYYPNGDTAWMRRYEGPGTGWDFARAIAVDNSGNVYVTGWSYGNYATIKYDSLGNQFWVEKYNPSTKWLDSKAMAMALDDSGNVYVTGWSSGNRPYQEYDYATVKYDTQGNQLWANRYDGAYGGDDYANAITVDDSGNVYVTGGAFTGSDSGYVYATIKYNPEGAQLWAAIYSGPGHNYDMARAIAVDNSGNAYVTGYSLKGEPYYQDYDYATIKYYPNGDTAWVRRYDGPSNSADTGLAIAVDNSRNVYVTGYSSGSGGQAFGTIKYDSLGNQLWVKRYQTPGYCCDAGGNAIALDGSGNVYVAGIGAGAYSTDYAIIKYDSNGNQLWVERYNGPGNGNDRTYAIAVDNAGVVYVTGLSMGAGTDYDYATIKYIQGYRPIVTAPDSSKFLCGPDTLRFTITATSQDIGDTITLSGPGIPTPVKGLSPVSANAKIFVSSTGSYNYIYQATSQLGLVDYDTATWIIATNNGNPNSFSLLSPSDSSTILSAVTFKWQTATDPDSGDQVRYDLILSTSSNFQPDSTVIYDSLLTNQYTDSLGIGAYYWKVRNYDRCDSGTFSNQTWTFRTVLFVRGDANRDAKVTVADVVYLVNYLFKGGTPPNPFLAGDANCDGNVNVSDVIYLINYLFKGGPKPPCS